MEFSYLRELLVFLVIAGLLVPALQRMKVSPILGFLGIGILVGPHGLAHFADELTFLDNILITDLEGVRQISEVGIIFLLFMIGLEMSISRLMSLRHLVLGLGSLQIILSAAVIMLIAWGWGNSVESSIVLGACLALSSTAIVMQLLTEQRRFGSPVGQSSFAILLAQDIAVVPLLFITAMLGASDSGSPIVALGVAMGSAAIAIILIMALGRIVIRPLFRFVGGLRSPEAFLAITLLVIAVTSLATHEAGLSAALGAFLVGLLLSETEYRHEIEHSIAPFKGMLLGLFFISIGMGIDIREVAANPFWIFASILGLIAIKAAIITGLMKLYRFNTATSVETGLLLGQGGEFAFVIIGLAMTFALVPTDIAQFMLIVVSGTMMLTPVIAILARRIGQALSGDVEEETAEVAPDTTGHVVICGYGRIGQLLAEMIEAQKTPHVALELDVGTVKKFRDEGVAIFHADATRPGILEQVGIENALAFVITMDDHDAAERVLQTARSVAPHVPIVMRAHDAGHAEALREHGADHVIPEVFEAGLQMSRVLLTSMGYPEEAARDIVAERRDAAGEESK